MAEKNPFNMGIGYVGDPNVQFMRKMRWTMEFHYDAGAAGSTPTSPAGPGKTVGPYLVNVTARPSISFEETEVHFLHERIYLSGKPSYEPISMTMYDIAGNSEVARWLYEVYKFGKHGRSGPMSETLWYKWTGYLAMYNGESDKIQEWILHGCWPTQVNYGDLDYTASDTANVEVTLRFDSIDLTYPELPGTTGNLAISDPGNFSTNNAGV